MAAQRSPKGDRENSTAASIIATGKESQESRADGFDEVDQESLAPVTNAPKNLERIHMSRDVRSSS